MILALLACRGPAVVDTASEEVTVLTSPWVGSPRAAVDLDADPQVLRVDLRASPATLQVNGVAVEAFAYADRDEDGRWKAPILPGPTLRARVGDTLVLTLQNDLPVPTTIHWHGVAAPVAMDGAAWMDTPIPAGGTFTYTVPLTTAGTSWYHPHVGVDAQVDLGLYGFLVVEAPAEPDFDAELLLAFDTWGEGPGAEMAGGSHARSAPPPASDTAHGGGDDHGGGGAVRWLVNGRADARVSLRAGARVRARLLNASNAAYLDLRGPLARLLADDQGLLGSGLPKDRLILAPGDRVEVEWLPGPEPFTLQAAPFALFGGEALGAPQDVLAVDVQGEDDPAAPVGLPFDGALPTPDPGRTDVRYVLSGDVHADDWRINRERWPGVTPTDLVLGQEVVLEVRNLSPSRHPFHVHGHRLEVLSVDGAVPATRTVVDNQDVGIREVVRFRMIADNPGEWMVHCHVLGHEEHGMMTLLRVR